MAPKVKVALASPYSAVKWPNITSDAQEAITKELCSLLTPIGTHRRLIMESTRRSRKRKRKLEASDKTSAIEEEEDVHQVVPPAAPAIKNFLTIGLNATTRHLETLVQLYQHDPPHPSNKGDSNMTNSTIGSQPKQQTDVTTLPMVTAIFLPRTKNDTIYAHLPIMTELLTLNLRKPKPEKSKAKSNSLPQPACTNSSPHGTSDQQQTCLFVPLNPSSESLLATALQLPRVGVIGLLAGAPGADALLELVRVNVGPVESGWLRDAVEGTYKGACVVSGNTSDAVKAV